MNNAKEKLVSIIVPVYNVEDYIEDCIKSLINQNYKNIEIILINDGSSDLSEEICRTYQQKDKRIKLYSIQNSGVSTARNLGIKKSKGDYILFVDSDDEVNDNYVSYLLKNASELCLSICNFSTNISHVFEDRKNSNFTNHVFYKEDFIELYKYNLLNTPCCKLFDRSIIIKNNIHFNQDLSLGEDLLFNLEYFNEIDKITFLNDYLYYYRFHGNNSLSSRYNEEAKSIQLMLIDNITNSFINTNNLKLLNKCRMDRIISILENEMCNKDISFIRRYINVIHLLQDKDIRRKIELYRTGYNTFYYYLLKLKLYLCFKICKKIFS